MRHDGDVRQVDKTAKQRRGRSSCSKSLRFFASGSAEPEQPLSFAKTPSSR
jgi:hypothetical protein